MSAVVALLCTACGGSESARERPTETTVTTVMTVTTATTVTTVTPVTPVTAPATVPSPAAPPSTAPSPTAAAPATTAATEAPAATAVPAPPAASLPEPFADLVVPVGDVYCDWARHAAALFERWTELTRTPSENEAYLAGLRTAWEQMQRTAPAELGAHFPIVTELYLYVWQTLEESGYDIDAQQAEFGDEITGRRDQTFLAAAQTIESYGIGVCGITPP